MDKTGWIEVTGLVHKAAFGRAMCRSKSGWISGEGNGIDGFEGF